jgi:hypothetical protein
MPEKGVEERYPDYYWESEYSVSLGRNIKILGIIFLVAGIAVLFLSIPLGLALMAIGGGLILLGTFFDILISLEGEARYILNLMMILEERGNWKNLITFYSNISEIEGK